MLNRLDEADTILKIRNSNQITVKDHKGRTQTLELKIKPADPSVDSRDKTNWYFKIGSKTKLKVFREQVPDKHVHFLKMVGPIDEVNKAENIFAGM